MISQRLKIIIVSFLILFSIALLAFNFNNSCPTKYFEIMEEIKKYENNLDPDLCDSIVNKISDYEDSCSDVIEQLDCG